MKALKGRVGVTATYGCWRPHLGYRLAARYDVTDTGNRVVRAVPFAGGRHHAWAGPRT